MKLHFYYDLVCPYAYLASLAVEDLAVRTGAELVWEPVLLGGVLRAVGSPDAPATAWSPARVAMGEADLLRQAALLGAPLRRNPAYPVKSLPAMRLLTAASPDARPALSRALFHACHVEGVDLGDRQILASFADRFGLSPDTPDQIAVKDALRTNTQQAIDRGLFGVPGFWAQTPARPEGRLWWGADRMHLVEASLRGISNRLDAPAELQRNGVADRPLDLGRPAQLQVFHDFASPYSYLGATQAQRIADEHGAELAWRPMLLGALFRSIGTADVPIAVMNAARARYGVQDLCDWAAWWGVPFAFPDCFPVRSVTALRVSIIEPRVVQVLYRALWVDGQNIGDDDVLRRVLAAHGFDSGLVEAATQPAVKQALRDHTDQAIRMGACGAPSFLVRADSAGTDRPLPDLLVWGQDRFDVVGAALDGWRPPG
ncbi:MAG: hypothetical protein GXP62_00600 [Oligoflexia bacterium]|nr:hypothetical protein [Oligoflexia bacterium]